MDTKREFEKLRKQHEKLMRKAEKDITQEYKDALAALRDLMGETFTKYEIAGALTYIEMARYKRLVKLQKSMDTIVTGLYKKSGHRIKEALKEDYLLGYNMVRDMVTTHTGKGLIPIVKDEVLQRTMYNDISGLKWTDRLGLHRDTAVMKIRETVTQGLKEGSTYGQMSKRLNETLSGQVVQPTRIVRTEGHRVINEAKKDSLDVAAKKGVKMTKTWLTARDEVVRGNKPTDKANHVEMEGVTVPYEEDFVMSDGSKGFGPGMIGVARHDINCRCEYIIDFLDSVIEDKYENTVVYEPEITADIQKVIEKNDGKMEGLDFRTKSLDSYNRKVSDEIAKAKNVDNGLNGIYDTIRYTSVKEPGSLTQHYFSVIADLENKGYNIVRVKNTWGKVHEPYKGINAVIEAPSKQKFELQFHTPESFDLKENKLHKLYEEARLTSTSKERIWELTQQMQQMSQSLTKPSGIEKIVEMSKL